jgi:hypothetical protein
VNRMEPAEPPKVVIFPGDGEMARRARAYPWADSPLGDPRGWSASLRTACRICLTSRFPMIVWWGKKLWFLYNDAYLPLLGTKHPALGKPGEVVWPEIWDVIGPMLDSVMSSGQATWSEDLLLPMDRHGYWEETYWTYSHSPLHDDEGWCAGCSPRSVTPPSGSSASAGPCRTWALRQAAPAAWPKRASSW